MVKFYETALGVMIPARDWRRSFTKCRYRIPKTPRHRRSTQPTHITQSSL